MKNHMNRRSSDTQMLNDRSLYFTDQLCADEVAQLLNPLERSSKTPPNDSRPLWPSIFNPQVSKRRRDA